MSALKATRVPRELRRPDKVTPARWVAWHVVRRTFEEDAYTDRVLVAEAKHAGLDARDRAHAQRLAYGTVQLARRSDHVIARAGRRPLRKIDAPVLHVLRMGVFELLDDSEARAAHAAIDQSVEIVRAAVGERAVAFANAVLRRAQADARTWLAELDPLETDDLATLLSFPEWIVRRLRNMYGEDGVDALVAQNRLQPAAEHDSGTPMRINALRATAGEVDAQLEQLGLVPVLAGAAFEDALPEARIVPGPTSVVSALIDRGLLLPQSLSSMLVARALDPQSGERVLDMCAAPGGKAMHAAALMGGDGELLACDLHEHRAQSIVALATRCGADGIVDARQIDATTLDPSAFGTFDRVLVDAPCTGMGVLARRPDARWRRSEHELPGLLELQRQLLAAAARMVRPGGIVVYSTCTLLGDENESQAAFACSDLDLTADPFPPAVPQWLRLPDVEHMARVWPHVHRSDGSFLARMRRPGDEPARRPDDEPAPRS